MKYTLPTLFLSALKGSMPGLLFVLVGMVTIFIMHGLYAKRQHILDHGIRTEAVVVDVNTQKSHKRKGRSHTHYHPVLSFTDTRGCPQRIESPQDYYLKRGEKAQICYLANNPLQLEILPPKKMTALLIIMCGGGVFCLGGGAMMIAGFRHHLNKSNNPT